MTHTKRLSAPKSYAIHRKEHIFTIAVRGPHKKDNCMPLGVLIKDVLGLADISKEARNIIKKGLVLVNGKILRDTKYGVGLMDVLSIPRLDLHMRVSVDKKGLKLVKIKKDEIHLKISKVISTRHIKGNKIQVNLHDGNNILSDKTIPPKSSVVLKIPQNKIVKVLEFKKGAVTLITGGKHKGEMAFIKDIIKEGFKTKKANLHSFKDFETLLDYVFVVGGEKPEVTVV